MHIKATQTDLRRSISDREHEIIASLVVGATAQEISRELAISPHTVRTHIRNIYYKLGVANRIELLRWKLSSESDNTPPDPVRPGSKT